MRGLPIVLTWLGACALAACAANPGNRASLAPSGSPRPATAGELSTPDESPIHPRPANAESDADYFGTRSTALATATSEEISRTDFFRFRHGRLYARGVQLSPEEQALQRELATAFRDQDFATVIDVTALIIVDDPSDIRSHLLRAFALRSLQRPEEAEFHRAMAGGLLKSILDSGDGRSFASAWTVFSIKEEYEVLKVLGCVPATQSLTPHEGRNFDVFEARRLDTGEAVHMHFDVTELFAEEQRLFQAP